MFRRNIFSHLSTKNRFDEIFIKVPRNTNSEKNFMFSFLFLVEVFYNEKKTRKLLSFDKNEPEKNFAIFHAFYKGVCSEFLSM